MTLSAFYKQSVSTVLSLIFIFLVVLYFASKVLGIFPIYPIALGIFVIYRPQIIMKLIKNSVWLLAYGAYAFLFGEAFVLSKEVLMGAVVSYVLINIFLEGVEESSNRYLDYALVFIGATITVLFIVGGILKFHKISPLIEWGSVYKLFSRYDNYLRHWIISFFNPFGTDHKLAGVFLSFQGLTGIWMAIRISTPGSEARVLRKGLCVVILSLILSISRGPLLGILFIFIFSKIKHYAPYLNRVIPFLSIFPILLILISHINTSGDFNKDKFYNGRAQIYRRLSKDISLTGNGIGAASKESAIASFNHNNHPHNIHLEVMFDLGLIVFMIIFFKVVRLLYRKKAMVTSAFLFIVCSYSYTIYSPWTWFTIWLCLGADEVKNLKKIEEKVVGDYV